MTRLVPSLAGAALVLCGALVCDILTTGHIAASWMLVLTAALGGAALWSPVLALARRFHLPPLSAPAGRFVLLAVALAFALADAYAGALQAEVHPFLLPTTLLLTLAGAISGIAIRAALSRPIPEAPS
ncbi:hypothetical protein [Rhodospirillum sp. A1_3_36]|uniref:hypothetical protein n=1 Tax=Rhodospirillum sp. A1_3_36 TaxID=3391666 RepID=UPI0039A7524A